MGKLGAWPDLSRERVPERMEHGLGASRHKEFEIAPYVELVHAIVPAPLWSSVFFSWLSMKGHLQGFHEEVRTEMYATRVDDLVYAVFLTVWRHADAMAVWMERGYPVEEMLRQVGIPADNINVTLLRDYS